MKLELHKNKDFWAGMMFIGFGTAAVFVARDYWFGSALEMGPGFFPTIIGGILIAFGICIIAVGLHNKEKIKVPLSLRAVVMLPLSLVLFGVLMSYESFIPALVAVIWGAAGAGREFKVIEILLLTALLVVLALLIFVWGLNLPYPLI